MSHAFILDFESYVFPDIPAFQSLSPQERKRLDNGHVLRALDHILDFFYRNETTVSFAVVAELYEWYPEAIERIAEHGHEIGYHGHTHRIMSDIHILEEELDRSRAFLDTFKPALFQAPAIHFPRQGYTILRQAGFRCSNSVYGGQPFEIDGILEVPASTMRWNHRQTRTYPAHMSMSLAIRNVPFGSGLLAAVLPASYLVSCHRKAAARGEHTLTFFHEWQLVDIPDRCYPTWKDNLRAPLHYPYSWNIWNKFTSLVKDISFCTVRDVYEACTSSAEEGATA